ncbi:MAG: VUT family protein, partial [Neisseriaceae bacterium]
TNELLWLSLIIVNFSATLLAFRLFGKAGLFIFAVISIIMANIQALKQIDIFGLHGSMGDISYMGVYLISDILSENYGKDEARKIIGVGLFSIISATIIMYISLQLIPNNFDTVQSALNQIFGVFPRFVLASICAFLVSQSYDIVAYQFWRKKFPDFKYIWIRNGASTMISQIIDNLIFSLIAFIGIFEFKYIMEIFVTSFVLRSIITVIDTPFVYWSVAIKRKIKEI